MLKEKITTTTLEIDNKNYLIIDEVEWSGSKYCYLVNINDPEDVVIRKYDSENLVNLSTEQEFDNVIEAFYKKSQEKLANN